MSTDLYGIRVLEKNGPYLTIRVFVVYDDAVLPNPALPGFFFLVIAENHHGPSPVTQAIGDVWYQGNWDIWVAENASQYIAHAHLLETKNHPGRPEYTFYYERNGRWQDEDHLPQGVYCITVTDPKWIAHLSTGDAWGSPGYQPELRRIVNGNKAEWNRVLTGLEKEGKQNKLKVNDETLERLITALDHSEGYVVCRAEELLERLGTSSSTSTHAGH